MSDYYLKYLKYKNKYLELKNKLKGGAELKIIYANVGVDKDGNPYCDDIYTPAKTAKQLNYVIDTYKENMDVLMFCEFCGSALNLLIDKLNSIDSSGETYGLVLLAQKRDNKQYKTQEREDEKGIYYVSGETDIFSDKKVKFERFKKDFKPLHGYHPDVIHPTLTYTEDFPFNGYDFNFKFFGYIYRRSVVTFNLDQTFNNLGFRIPIQQISESDLHLDKIYKDGSIDTDIKPRSSPVNTRPIHMVKLYDFNLTNFDNNGISQNLLQYCGLATFNKISEPQSMVTLLVPHLLGTRKYTKMWQSQFTHIANKIQTLQTPTQYVYMMGDFNIRVYGEDWRILSDKKILETIQNIENENTLYTNNITATKDDTINLKYSVHKVILGTCKLSLLGNIYEQPRPISKL